MASADTTMATEQRGFAPANEAEGIKGRIEKVDDLYKVLFYHDGHLTELGLFGTLDESHRVCDVLNIKEAVDARQDLETVRLHFDLARYGVDNDTAGEIRSVSFNQVVRDLMVCAVQPLYGAMRPEETQQTSWAQASAAPRAALTGGTVFHDAVADQGRSSQVTVPPATGPSPPGLPRGGVHLPPRGLRRATTTRGAPSKTTMPDASAARNAFAAAGIANASAAAAEGPGPAGQRGGAAPSPARPHKLPPPKFDGAPQQQAQQQAPPQQQEEAPPQQQQNAQPQQQNAQSQPQKRATNNNMNGLPAERTASDAPRSARKRAYGEESEGEQGAEGEQEEVAARGVAAAAAGSGRNSKGAAMRRQPSSAAAAAPAPAAGEEKGGKKRKRGAAGAPVDRPWQDEDVMAIKPSNHPFHGITCIGNQGMAAQIKLNMAGERFDASGRGSRVVRLARCDTPAEAAASWDLAAIWRAMQYGQDPASLDADEVMAQRLNFDFSRYAAQLPMLRSADTSAALQGHVLELRNNGTLAELASGSAAKAPTAAPARPPAGTNNAAAGAAAAAAAAGAGASGSRGTAGAKARVPKPPTAAAAPAADAAAAAGRAASAGGQANGLVRSSSGFKGVHGSSDTWAAQISLNLKKLLPERSNEWTCKWGEQVLRIAKCSSAQLAAACYDLLLLSRCMLYGDNPAALALNYPLPAYASLRPALATVTLDSVAQHIAQLRDSGALEVVLAGGRATPVTPAVGLAASPATRPAAARRSAAAPPAGRELAVDAAAAAAALRTDEPGPSGRQQQVQQQAQRQQLLPSQEQQQQQQMQQAPQQPPPQPPPPQQQQHVLGANDGMLMQAYYPYEVEQVQVQQRLYWEVQAWLSGVRQLSELEVVGYMAVFARHRDMRTTFHTQIKEWNQAGKTALMVEHVRKMLARVLD